MASESEVEEVWEDEIEEMAWTLWCCALCMCENCRTLLEDVHTTEMQERLDKDPTSWSKKAAPVALNAGWMAMSEWDLLCPKCFAQKKNA